MPPFQFTRSKGGVGSQPLAFAIAKQQEAFVILENIARLEARIRARLDSAAIISARHDSAAMQHQRQSAAHGHIM